MNGAQGSSQLPGEDLRNQEVGWKKSVAGVLGIVWAMRARIFISEAHDFG